MATWNDSCQEGRRASSVGHRTAVSTVPVSRCREWKIGTSEGCYIWIVCFYLSLFILKSYIMGGKCKFESLFSHFGPWCLQKIIYIAIPNSWFTAWPWVRSLAFWWTPHPKDLETNQGNPFAEACPAMRSNKDHLLSTAKIYKKCLYYSTIDIHYDQYHDFWLNTLF